MVNTTINAKEINIDITTKDGDVHCLEAQNIKYADKQSKLTVNSDVNIKNAQGAFAVYGIYSRGNSALEINGDVTMKNEEGGYAWFRLNHIVRHARLYATELLTVLPISLLMVILILLSMAMVQERKTMARK